MRRNLWGRLERLEREPLASDTDDLPPRFWEVIGGFIPPEELDPETRRWLEAMCQPPDPAEQDTLERRLAEEARALGLTYPPDPQDERLPTQSAKPYGDGRPNGKDNNHA